MMTLDDMVEKQNEVKKQLREEGKAALLAESQAIFTQFPYVSEILFTAYAPYFNDGDACIFHIHDIAARCDGDPITHQAADGLTGEDEDEDSEDEDEDDMGYWDLVDQDREPALQKALNNLYKKLSSIEDFVRDCITEDGIVVLHRAGTITIDEYSHD